MSQESLLKVRDLKISFKDRDKNLQVVRGVNFNVNKGEIVGILGESGSGKTVSTSAILRLIEGDEGRVDSGGIEFKGKNLIKLTDKEIRSIRGNQISFIFQNPVESLNPFKKVGKQLMETLKAHGLKSSKDIILKTLESVGIDNGELISNMYPFQLSGGQCQRVMIAIGIICKPDLLIADEPTSAIDASIKKKILNLLKEINKKYGTSVIIITHDFDVAKFLCHKLYIMYGGLVMEYGKMDDILNNPVHPYTKELLNCVNSLDKADGSLYVLDGNPPNPHEFKDECPFFDRCPKNVDECKSKIPDLINIGGRMVRCIGMET